MNPIDELRAARPAHLGERPVDEHTRAVELARAMSGPRRPKAARRRSAAVRPAWGLGLAGAAAAAVTAVAVVMSGNGPTTPPAPDGGRLAVSESPGSTSAPRVKLSAREVLLAAAEKAGRQREGSGDYWHSVTVLRTLFAAKQGGYLVVEKQRSEGWTPSATGGEQWFRSQSLGVQPAGETDRQAWERAGSPSEIEIVVPGKRLAATLSTSEGKVRTDRSPLVDGDKVFWLGKNVSMQDLRELPGDPGKLKRWLLASYKGHGTESSSEKMSGDVWLFRVSVGLIMDMPVTPEVRGAAFRMLAELDGVEVTEDVTDSENRQGTAVSIEEPGPRGGVTENRLIFDEETGRPLAVETVAVKPGKEESAFEPGLVRSSNVLLEAGWTDARPAS
ncbi:CU044_5270 family protein [Nonomuraea sp. NPDC050643]|uniref:CU044_5270 family protein n=1 Tax=Nonomuraea sp. NPDC050643 TaxID=3155660 RepID=UPI0033DC979C